MKNDKIEFEKEITIKEREMINLEEEKNQLDLKNIKSNLIQNINKSGYFENKKLLRNDSNCEVKKVNIERKIFKLYIKIIIYIIINSCTILLSNNNNFLFESKFSNITLKIKGIGNKNILGTNTNNFNKNYYPNLIYINGKQNFTITNKYYFDKDDNYIDLIWNNTIDSCYFMFYKCSDIIEIDLSNFDSSNVSTMGYMFYGCSQLSSLNLSNFDTSNVANMECMFCFCSQLSSLNLSNFVTSTVTNMICMFQGCTQLSVLNLSNFATSKVKYMGYMFYNCSKLSLLN